MCAERAVPGSREFPNMIDDPNVPPPRSRTMLRAQRSAADP